jgi:hypothetical protein
MFYPFMKIRRMLRPWKGVMVAFELLWGTSRPVSQTVFPRVNGTDVASRPAILPHLWRV